MKPLKERLDDAALAYNEEEIKNEFNTNSLDAFIDGANWMQAEMQKEIDELVEALEFYANEAKYLDYCVNISIPGNKKQTSSIEDDFGRRARHALIDYKGAKDE